MAVFWLYNGRMQAVLGSYISSKMASCRPYNDYIVYNGRM